MDVSLYGGTSSLELLQQVFVFDICLSTHLLLFALFFDIFRTFRTNTFSVRILLGITFSAMFGSKILLFSVASWGPNIFAAIFTAISLWGSATLLRGFGNNGGDDDKGNPDNDPDPDPGIVNDLIETVIRDSQRNLRKQKKKTPVSV